MSDIEVTIKTNNKDLVKSSTRAAIQTALEAVGLSAEGYAKEKCPVDTGLLRNSITHAVSGKTAAASSYHASYGTGRDSNGKRIDASDENAGNVGYGAYSGTIGSPGENAVYIGTNVEYGSYVEFGTSHSDPQPFLKPAVENHVSEYKRIIENILASLR